MFYKFGTWLNYGTMGMQFKSNDQIIYVRPRPKYSIFFQHTKVKAFIQVVDRIRNHPIMVPLTLLKRHSVVFQGGSIIFIWGSCFLLLKAFCFSPDGTHCRFVYRRLYKSSQLIPFVSDISLNIVEDIDLKLRQNIKHLSLDRFQGDHESYKK